MGSGFIIQWPAVVGKTSQIQYTDNLKNPVWHTLPAAVHFIGSQRATTDLSPSPTQRYYRIISN